MTKECVWYNGEVSNYKLLSFDPNRLTNKEIKDKAWEILNAKYQFGDYSKDSVLENLYLIDIDNLEKVK